MYWGDELVAIYNEAYIGIVFVYSLTYYTLILDIGLAGQKHPWLMGSRYQDAWAEIWIEVKDVFANARQTGQATMKVGAS